MEQKAEKKYEADMYEPIRNYFVAQGYDVFGEVKHCDLTAIKDEELIIVEFKRNLSVELLIQATKRQRYTDFVYVAIPKPKYKLYSKKWQDICYLVRRLELGLILVSFPKRGAAVMEVNISPGPFDRVKSKQFNQKKRSRIIEEMKGRYGDYNVGGSYQTKLMTAYKQSCIQIATLLQQYGPLSPKSLKSKGAKEKTSSILIQNHYGWFTRVQRGLYAITPTGERGIAEYPELIAYYQEQAEKIDSSLAPSAESAHSSTTKANTRKKKQRQPDTKG